MTIKNQLQCMILFIMSGFFSLSSEANSLPDFDLTGYQSQDGEITVGYKGNFVDPYFAMRALLTASEEGLDTRKSAIPWIKWLIKKQRPDGRFDRYCKLNYQYITCMPADADDVNMALWVQLLTEFAQNPDMPPTWRQSYGKAIQYLQEKLYNPQLGIYHISVKQPVGLFMDNVEIAHAFFKIAALKKKQGKFLELDPQVFLH